MKRATALAALLPLTFCWAQAASALAQTAPAAPPAQIAEQPPLVAGTIAPQTFTQTFTLPPPARYQLPPREDLNSEQNTPRFIDPIPPREARDRGLNFGPFIIRRDPNPEPGCRFGIRGARLQYRCVR